jgi:release factor glutamine methyltransferase
MAASGSESDLARQPIAQSSFPSRKRGFVASGADLAAWWQSARQQAIATATPLPELDWLLQELTDLSALDLRLGHFSDRAAIALDLPLSTITGLWQQRIQQRTPVQYLVGRTPWRNFLLRVSPAVLIPRPETELLVDLVCALPASQSAPLHLADLGTGSGAIALGLAQALPHATLHAVDISAEALAIAHANAAAYGLGDRIQFYQGDWFTPLQPLPHKLSGMVSNPPYIPSRTVLALQPEVTQHEPHLALDGGDDGLAAVRHLIQQAPGFLQPGGFWLVELMAGQADRVCQLLQQTGHYQAISIHSDLAAIPRFVLAHLR